MPKIWTVGEEEEYLNGFRAEVVYEDGPWAILREMPSHHRDTVGDYFIAYADAPRQPDGEFPWSLAEEEDEKVYSTLVEATANLVRLQIGG